MEELKTIRGGLIALAAGLVLIASACSGGGKPAPGDASPGAGDGDVSADEKIAFVSFRDGQQEIYIMNSDGTEERNLTNDPADDFDPDLPADGKRLAFVSKRSGRAQVHVMDLDGTNVRQITQDGGLSPRWSSDGSRIAFSRGGAIWVAPAGGGNPELVIDVDTESPDTPCRAGAFPGGWSPDDKRIAYYSASTTVEEGQVCTVNADGSDVRVVVANPGAYDVEPSWSPDGRYLAYRGVEGGVHDIWVVDLETGKTTNLTADPDLDIEPNWSPDGEWIAFGSLRPRASNFDIFIMRRDGSDVRRLTDDPAKEANPAWSP